MSSPLKPQEFWISDDNPLDECSDAHVYDNKPAWMDDSVLHVVEKSAYDRVIEVLKRTRKRISFQETHSPKKMRLWLEHTKQDAVRVLKELGEIE